MIYFCVRHYVLNTVDVSLLLKDFKGCSPHSVVIK